MGKISKRYQILKICQLSHSRKLIAKEKCLSDCAITVAVAGHMELSATLLQEDSLCTHHLSSFLGITSMKSTKMNTFNTSGLLLLTQCILKYDYSDKQ